MRALPSLQAHSAATMWMSVTMGTGAPATAGAVPVGQRPVSEATVDTSVPAAGAPGTIEEPS